MKGTKALSRNDEIQIVDQTIVVILFPRSRKHQRPKTHEHNQCMAERTFHLSLRVQLNHEAEPLTSTS